MQLKHHFYKAYAFAFLGESLLKEDKCGEAVRFFFSLLVLNRTIKSLFVYHLLICFYLFNGVTTFMVKLYFIQYGFRACKEGISEFKIASDFAAKYAVATGPGELFFPVCRGLSCSVSLIDFCYGIVVSIVFISGARIKPETHLFFRRIEPLLDRHLEKAERENGFIYHQKVSVTTWQLMRNSSGIDIYKPVSNQLIVQIANVVASMSYTN